MSTPKDADLEAARVFLGVARNVWLKDPNGTWLQDLAAFRREAREQGRREGIRAAEGAISDECYCDAWYGLKVVDAHELDCAECRGAIAAIRAVRALKEAKGDD